ncbi:EspA/EspE family type VII secretion system effector [Mycobacterium sp. 48b]|uniref:EspA/EspE family type VII secretion system effector n=1 Tax=Mycobacterium sp. 48b TaxID=3400426 RepID=UPI003AB00277
MSRGHSPSSSNRHGNHHNGSNNGNHSGDSNNGSHTGSRNDGSHTGSDSDGGPLGKLGDIKDAVEGVGDIVDDVKSILEGDPMGVVGLVSDGAQLAQMFLPAAYATPIIEGGMIALDLISKTLGFGDPNGGDDFNEGATALQSTGRGLEQAYPQSWEGTSSGAYSSQNSKQIDRTSAMISADNQVISILGTEAEQVATTRDNMDNIATCLGAVIAPAMALNAIPVYGQAASLSLQAAAVAVASGAAGVTMGEMVSNAMDNANQLEQAISKYQQVSSEAKPSGGSMTEAPGTSSPGTPTTSGNGSAPTGGSPTTSAPTGSSPTGGGGASSGGGGSTGGGSSSGGSGASTNSGSGTSSGAGASSVPSTSGGSSTGSGGASSGSGSGASGGGSSLLGSLGTLIGQVAQVATQAASQAVSQAEQAKEDTPDAAEKTAAAEAEDAKGESPEEAGTEQQDAAGAGSEATGERAPTHIAVGPDAEGRDGHIGVGPAAPTTTPLATRAV